IRSIIRNGSGRMVGFPGMEEAEITAVVRYLQGLENEKIVDPAGREMDVPWKFDGYQKFLDSEGHPGIAPPWGQLTAIDLSTGDHLWQIPLGETDMYKDLGITRTGTENYGGPLATAGGLLFIAATNDRQFRAFNRRT